MAPSAPKESAQMNEEWYLQPSASRKTAMEASVMKRSNTVTLRVFARPRWSPSAVADVSPGPQRPMEAVMAAGHGRDTFVRKRRKFETMHKEHMMLLQSRTVEDVLAKVDNDQRVAERREKLRLETEQRRLKKEANIAAHSMNMDVIVPRLNLKGMGGRDVQSSPWRPRVVGDGGTRLGDTVKSLGATGHEFGGSTRGTSVGGEAKSARPQWTARSGGWTDRGFVFREGNSERVIEPDQLAQTVRDYGPASHRLSLAATLSAQDIKNLGLPVVRRWAQGDLTAYERKRFLAAEKEQLKAEKPQRIASWLRDDYVGPLERERQQSRRRRRVKRMHVQEKDQLKSLYSDRYEEFVKTANAIEEKRARNRFRGAVRTARAGVVGNVANLGASVGLESPPAKGAGSDGASALGLTGTGSIAGTEGPFAPVVPNTTLMRRVNGTVLPSTAVMRRAVRAAVTDGHQTVRAPPKMVTQQSGGGGLKLGDFSGLRVDPTAQRAALDPLAAAAGVGECRVFKEGNAAVFAGHSVTSFYHSGVFNTVEKKHHRRRWSTSRPGVGTPQRVAPAGDDSDDDIEGMWSCCSAMVRNAVGCCTRTSRASSVKNGGSSM